MPTVFRPAQAIALLRPMIGEYAWGVRTGQDSVLRMDFGAPRLRIREPKAVDAAASETLKRIARSRLVIPEGQWHLFIFDGVWTLGMEAITCTRRDAETSDVSPCLKQIEGQKLTDIAWRPGEGGMAIQLRSWRHPPHKSRAASKTRRFP